MAFIRDVALKNVAGRIAYIDRSRPSDSERSREELQEVYDTVEMRRGKAESVAFWKALALENRAAFKASTHAERAGAKCEEAREFTIAIPHKYVEIKRQGKKITSAKIKPGTAKLIAEEFKAKYGVEVHIGIHVKISDRGGYSILNVHGHAVYANRKELAEPEVIEERRAPRTYYYNAEGKKCKKAEAVKVVPKGTITQKAEIKLFGKKMSFYGNGFLQNLTQDMSALLGLTATDKERFFTMEHLGKYNPTDKKYNERRSRKIERVKIKKQFNKWADKIEKAYPEYWRDTTPKQIFREIYGKQAPWRDGKEQEFRNCFNYFKRDVEKGIEIYYELQKPADFEPEVDKNPLPEEKPPEIASESFSEYESVSAPENTSEEIVNKGAAVEQNAEKHTETPQEGKETPYPAITENNAEVEKELENGFESLLSGTADADVTTLKQHSRSELYNLQENCFDCLSELKKYNKHYQRYAEREKSGQSFSYVECSLFSAYDNSVNRLVEPYRAEFSSFRDIPKMEIYDTSSSFYFSREKALSIFTQVKEAFQNLLERIEKILFPDHNSNQMEISQSLEEDGFYQEEKSTSWRNREDDFEIEM